MASQTIQSLTPREREILTLIAEGDSLSEIAQKLGRSLKTIESHRLSLGRKLKASNRVELAKIAYSTGLVRLPDGSVPAGSVGVPAGEPEQDLAILESINGALQNLSGHDYITALSLAVCQELDVYICGVCISAPEFGADQRFVIGMCRDCEMQPSFYYSLMGSPVTKTHQEGATLIEDGLAEAYPNFPLYKQFGLRSYCGLRLDGDYGAEVGILAITDTKPIESPERIERVLRFFVDRTATELSLLHKTKEIELLKQQIDKHENSPDPVDKPI